MTLTSLQLSTALGLVDRKCWRPLSWPILTYLRAATFDDPDIGSNGVLAASPRTMAARNGWRYESARQEIHRLADELGVIEHIRKGGRTSGGRPDVWAFDHAPAMWAVEWSIDRTAALNVIANVGFASPNAEAKPEFLGSLITEAKTGRQMTIYRRMATHQGEFLPRFIAPSQEAPVVGSHMGEATITTIRGASPSYLSSSNSPAQKEEGLHLTPKVAAVREAIRKVTGETIYDGAKHKALSRLIAALSGVEDVAPIVDAIVASRNGRWMQNLALVEHLATVAGGDVRPGGPDPVVQLRRQIAQLEMEISEQAAKGYPVDDEQTQLQSLHDALAACDDGPDPTTAREVM